MQLLLRRSDLTGAKNALKFQMAADAVVFSRVFAKSHCSAPDILVHLLVRLFVARERDW